MLLSSKKMILSAALLSTGILPATAQTFTTPIAPEHVLGSPMVEKPTHIAAYSTVSVYSAFGNHSLVAATWGNEGPGGYGGYSEVVWQFVDGASTTILNSGSFMYHDVVDMDVCTVYDVATNDVQLLVAYYLQGVGHRLDVYTISSTSTAPVFSHTIKLSDAPDYGRIRMDCFLQNQVVLVWEYPGLGIQSVAGENGSWGGIVNLDHTDSQFGPDVAIQYKYGVNNVQRIHYVYHNNNEITESTYDWATLYGSTPGATIFPIIEDVYTMPTGLYSGSKIVIDCPDLCNNDNWAYTYSDGENIFMRTMDYFTSTTPLTVSVNSGALGNVSTVGSYKSLAPAMHYGFIDQNGLGSPTDHVTLGWYLTDGGGQNRYVGMQVKADGVTMINTPDYMLLPNSVTGNTYPDAPGIAFSKQDLEAVTNYLYAAYYDFDDATGTYQLHHAFHPWGNTVFSGVKNIDVPTQTYPNPFTSQLNTAVALDRPGLVQHQLVDLTGKVVYRKSEFMNAGTHSMQLTGLNALTPGTYFLKTTINGQSVKAQTVIKQ